MIAALVRALHGSGQPLVRLRSEKTIGSLPLYEVAFGPRWSHGEQHGHARAVIAIGDQATGVVAVGGLAQGILAVGGLSEGVIAVGGCTLGLLLALGGVAHSVAWRLAESLLAALPLVGRRAAGFPSDSPLQVRQPSLLKSDGLTRSRISHPLRTTFAIRPVAGSSRPCAKKRVRALGCGRTRFWLAMDCNRDTDMRRRLQSELLNQAFGLPGLAGSSGGGGGATG